MPRKHKGSRKRTRKSQRGGNILESGEDLVKELMKMIGAGVNNQSGGRFSYIDEANALIPPNRRYQYTGDVYTNGNSMAGGNLSTYPSPLSYPIPLAMLGDTYSIRQGMDLSIGT
jgi:hypothetical protein